MPHQEHMHFVVPEDAICRSVYIYAVRLGSGPILEPATHHKTSDSVETQEK